MRSREVKVVDEGVALEVRDARRAGADPREPEQRLELPVGRVEVPADGRGRGLEATLQRSEEPRELLRLCGARLGRRGVEVRRDDERPRRRPEGPERALVGARLGTAMDDGTAPPARSSPAPPSCRRCS